MLGVSMDKINLHEGLVIPLDRSNVDTDAIIPKQFLKSVKRTGFGPYMFDNWRYEDEGQPGMDCSNRPLRKDFVFNLPQYQGASILLTRANFGCGSSREHAPWAILDSGIKIIIATSYADIFYNNCFKNGILPIVLSESEVDQLFNLEKANQALHLTVNLENQTITSKDASFKTHFEVEAFRKYCLLNGLDDIGLTLLKANEIKKFEEGYYKNFHWLNQDLSSLAK
jgi:3-isopropylmalate/(R)-2-methylmalate dehydratase small subunit